MDYARWVAMSDDELSADGIAAVNLACALGLPGTESVDTSQCLRKLEHWVELVRYATGQFLPKFRRAPENYGDSEASFRMLVMVTVLQRNLGVHYDPSCMEGPYDATEARTLFIHGLFEGVGGTCVSLPVLYTAIGRALGYALWVVETREHLFVRWEGTGGERFNIECTSQGFSPRTDEHYLKWPRPITPNDVDRNGYLRNLSPREELALFLLERGNCLADNLLIGPAMDAYSFATRIRPNSPSNRAHWAVATMMFRITEDLERAGFRDCWRFPPAEFQRILVSCNLPVREPWELWALPRAKERLERIYNIHHQRFTAAGTNDNRTRARSTVFSNMVTMSSDPFF